MFRILRPLSLISLPVLFLLLGCSFRESPTPLETAQGDSLTSHEAMLAFLSDLHQATGAFAMDTIGVSGEGREMVLLRFSDTPEGEEAAGSKLKVFMYAQQHGNEPSGKEAAIALARDIATGSFSDFLGSVDFYLIPQVNPDGSEARRRQNAEGKDLNRDHITLFAPEVAVLHSVFNQVLPEVTLDIHEYGFAGRSWVDAGFHKDFGQQIGGLSNANMSTALRSYASNRVIPTLTTRLSPKDVYLQRYLVTDGPDARFRYSTAALNDGRNSMGIYNSLSFLIEGMNGETTEENIRERARQQLETMKAFALFFSENAQEVKDLVHGERAKLLGANAPPQVALVMDYVGDPARPTLPVGVIDLETGMQDTLIVEAFHPRVESTLSVRRPLGYVIPSSLTTVLGVLERHGIGMETAAGNMEATLESYRIARVTPTQKEDKDFLEVDVVASRRWAGIAAGDVIVWCDQPATNLIVSLLEPQSQWGLAPLPEFVEMLEVGSEYPIRRIVEGSNR